MSSRNGAPFAVVAMKGKFFISTPEDTGPDDTRGHTDAFTPVIIPKAYEHDTASLDTWPQKNPFFNRRNYIPHQGAPPRRVVAGPPLCGETQSLIF